MLTQKELHDRLDYCLITGVFKWKVSESPRVWPGKIAGTPKGKEGYLLIRVKGKLYRANRLAWFYVYGHWPVYEIDHINRDRQDNRFVNLRDVSREINHANRSVSKNGPKKPRKIDIYFGIAAGKLLGKL